MFSHDFCPYVLEGGAVGHGTLNFYVSKIGGGSKPGFIKVAIDVAQPGLFAIGGGGESPADPGGAGHGAIPSLACKKNNHKKLATECSG